MTSIHCFYFALSKILEINECEKVDHFILFHALGGHQITIYDIENENDDFSFMDIRGNKFDYKKFEKNTGVNITKVFQEDKDFTFETLENGGAQLVYANCFYLPYDEKNYQKISDEHMVVIENYLQDADLFIVTDVDHHKAKIKASDLELAREELKHNKNMYFSLKRIDKTIDLNILSSSLKAIIKSNAISLKEHFYDIELKIKNFLMRMNKCEPIFKKIASKQMYRNFNHPNGLIVTRLIMKESLETYRIYSNEVIKLYSQLNKDWIEFSNDLLRYGRNRISIFEMINKLERIMELEKRANDLLI